MGDVKFQSVFDDATTEEEQFDTMFGAEEDDDLMGFVLGESDSTLPNFEELHQTDDESTPNDLKKDVQGEETDNMPNKDTSDASTADLDDEAADLACPVRGIGAGGTSTPDPEDLDGASDAATSTFKEQEDGDVGLSTEDIEDDLTEDNYDDMGLDDDEKELGVEEGSCREGDGEECDPADPACDDQDTSMSSEPAEAPSDNATVDDIEEPIVDDETEPEPEDNEGYETPDATGSDDIEEPVEDEIDEASELAMGNVDGESDKDVHGDFAAETEFKDTETKNVNFDDIEDELEDEVHDDLAPETDLGESAMTDEIEDEIDGDIIDQVEDEDDTVSDQDIKDLEDVDDDDIMDMVMGED